MRNATRQENINNTRQTNWTLRQAANKMARKVPKNRLRVPTDTFVSLRPALCSCLPWDPHPLILRSTQCLLCESKIYLQQTSDLPLQTEKPEKKTSFVKIIDCTLVLVLFSFSLDYFTFFSHFLPFLGWSPLWFCWKENGNNKKAEIGGCQRQIEES